MITLISPNIVTQKDDFFGSGIPYMPFTMCYLASYLRSKNKKISVIDSFGENPFQITTVGDFFYQGLTPNQVLDKIPKDTKFIVVSAERVVAHASLSDIIRTVKNKFVNIPVIVIENSQAVTAYSVRKIAGEFFKLGVNFVVIGEPEKRVEQLINCLENKKNYSKLDGLCFLENGVVKTNIATEVIENLDELPFPAWDLIPVKNYWKLGYSHAPLSSKKYLPLLTSRGCPYGCRFCVVPATNNRKWRSRSAENVVNELEYFNKKFEVSEFHLEDLNPTILKQRMIDISKGILNRNLKLSWKIGSGTKIEAADKETLTWMAKSGCTYVSISPESGSKRVLSLINKPFNHEHGLEMIKHMNSLGIYTQACFVLGFPGETKEDLLMTRKYMLQLTKAGLDEVALFIITPVPGSDIYDSFSKDMPKNINQLTFSPKWRSNYKYLHSLRTKLYMEFAFCKLTRHPVKMIEQFFNFMRKRFYTKMDMTVFRVMKLRKMARAMR